jgi:hypothetical protein
MQISGLKPGDPHFMAFVGPPEEYDFMGATQFRLLCSLGLRSWHDLLDVGCGSLRAGRFFITYLDEGRYCGIEPNRWLIDDAITRNLGTDLVRIKRPLFDGNQRFNAEVFGRQFDFILAQSIFSHAGKDLIGEALANFRLALKPTGLIAVTFIEAAEDFHGSGWIYPDCVSYRPETIAELARAANLHLVRIPWYHPRQTWYLLATGPACLPTTAQLPHLRGAVLNEPRFAGSWREPPAQVASSPALCDPIQQMLSVSVRRVLKKFWRQ